MLHGKQHRRSHEPSPRAQLTAEDRQRLETTFLQLLYDEFTKHQDSHGVVEADEPTHPEQSQWCWILHGTRQHWWLEVQDQRISELKGHPYYLDPRGDPQFFDLAWSPNPSDDLTKPERLPDFFLSIGTNMDENLFGQTAAIRAYKAGATTDHPPWVHTHN